MHHFDHYCVFTTFNRNSSYCPIFIIDSNGTQVFHGIWNQSTVKNLILLFTSFITKTLSPYFKFFLCMRLYRMFYNTFKCIIVSAIMAYQFLHLKKNIMFSVCYIPLNQIRVSKCRSASHSRFWIVLLVFAAKTV